MQKVALITGAGSGLGAGIARYLAKAGWDLAIHTGTNKERADVLADELRVENNCNVGVIVSDFSLGNATEHLFNQFRMMYSRLDLFVNNAGITKGLPILEMTEELYDEINNINLKNAYFSVQQAAKLMVETKTKGNIVIISSNNHAMNWYGISVYAMVKEALVKFTKHAAMEFAQSGIRVNCIAPGWIDTGEQRLLQGQKESSIPDIPMKRWVQPEEIGEWIVFLTSAASASLTGDTIELDGGVRIMSGPAKSYGL